MCHKASMQENEKTSDKNKSKHCNRVSIEKHRSKHIIIQLSVIFVHLGKVNIYKYSTVYQRCQLAEFSAA